MFDAELSVSEEVRKITAGSAYHDTRDSPEKSRQHTSGTARSNSRLRNRSIRSAENFAGIVQSMELGVSKDSFFFGRFPAPISRDNFALTPYDGADWQFTRLLGLACLLNGKLHILLIGVHTASLQSTRYF